MAGTIYALLDPAGEPRYVGQTIKPLEQRKSQHKHEAFKGKGAKPSPSRVHTWIRSIDHFTIQALEADVPDDLLDERERAWIEKALADGWRLTNLETNPRVDRGYKRSTPSARRIFTEDQVMEIRRRWAGYESLSSLAAAFECTKTCIAYIGLGISYPQLPVIPREKLHGREPSPCNVKGCDDVVGHQGGRGMCKKHYYRWYRATGRDPLRPPRPPRFRKPCKRTGCGSMAKARGLCPLHYSYWRRATGRDIGRTPKGATYRLF